MHVVLHPENCVKVIQKGRGQRHPLSGVAALKTIVNYVLVHVPRDDTEVDVALVVF